MSRDAQFVIVRDDPRDPLVIRDVGPWHSHLTVTNDAEGVVDKLFKSGKLQNGRRLQYYDSDGDLTELIVRDGRFAGFRRVE